MDSKTKKPSPPRDPATGRFIRRAATMVREDSPSLWLAPQTIPELSHELETWAKEDKDLRRSHRRFKWGLISVIALALLLILLVTDKYLIRMASAKEMPPQMAYAMAMCQARVTGALVTQRMLKNGSLQPAQYQTIQQTILENLAKQDQGTTTIAESTTTMTACHLLMSDLMAEKILTQ